MYCFLTVLFWLSIFIVCYAYAGYAVLLWLMVRIKEAVKGKRVQHAVGDYPEVTLLVAAYNEKDCVDAKVKNSMELEYPEGRLKLVWVTDGSDDGTPDLLRKYPEVTVYHQPVRAGKIAAMNRGMKLLDTPVVVFSDANTMLGRESVKRIVRLFADPGVGCVSGEKRIFGNEKDMAAGAGEGLYWKYESFLKSYDARLYSVVGAAGELFAIRREYYAEVEEDTLLDDFIISLRIAMKGHTAQYDPEAYACEDSSANVGEELKRKVRIAAGGFQSMVRLAPLLNIFKYGILSFQYISHRVLRWTLAPLCLLLLLVSNFALSLRPGLCSYHFFTIVFWLQVCFYAVALLGRFLANRRIKLKALFVPYYFLIMNYAVYLGFFRYMKKSQDVKWERAKRSNSSLWK
ncbi:MAG: glycosyltransferase family 2 protein [Bacteroidales bacterium]|jgi:cellulose synthase/poly-beta-1,6-N-acetylglucosamine synthase-like glycosyltransferase|nr:glycosyltransferase family 2 protein [Bacteroidales bacterium]